LEFHHRMHATRANQHLGHSVQYSSALSEEI